MSETREERLKSLDAEAKVSRRIAEQLKPLLDQLSAEWKAAPESEKRHVSGSLRLVRDLYGDYVRAAKNTARDAELIRGTPPHPNREPVE